MEVCCESWGANVDLTNAQEMSIRPNTVQLKSLHFART
jgi:hypothetical protein